MQYRIETTHGEAPRLIMTPDHEEDRQTLRLFHNQFGSAEPRHVYTGGPYVLDLAIDYCATQEAQQPAPAVPEAKPEEAPETAPPEPPTS